LSSEIIKLVWKSKKSEKDAEITRLCPTHLFVKVPV